MLVLKRFPVLSALFIILLLGLVGIAIWNSTKADLHFIDIPVTDAVSSDKDEVPAVMSDKPIPQDMPAPAKKLHQLINTTDKQLNEEQFLDKKVQGLDKQLAEINEQLKAQGVHVSEEAAHTLANQSDTKARLEAIKAHMSAK